MTSRPPLGPDPHAIEATLAAIVSSSDDAIFSKDPTGILTSWNPGAERLYGWKAEEAIGRSVRIIIPPHRRGEENMILEQILAGNRVDHYETERITKDGKLLQVSVSISPVHGGDGTVVGASVIARDITQRRREEDLEREIEKRDFIARAAHELKNPLTTIAGMAQILRDKETELQPHELEKVYSALIRQSDRANRLIADLLELARLESGQLQIAPVEVDLHRVLAESIDASAMEDWFGIENGVAPGTHAIADPFRLEEVFVNLFSNSAKYGATGVKVTATPVEDAVRVTVADDGPGIPADLVPDLFTPFTRGAATGVPGSGLGLSIAQRLCEAFEGSLELDDAAESGARFVITLRTP
jgi:PAS domain S-box-containing protein